MAFDIGIAWVLYFVQKMNKIDTQQPKIQEQTVTSGEKVNCCKKDPDYISALLLISAGCIFLLNNFGILSWDVWDILWRFWPLVIILLGLQLVFGKRGMGRIIVTIIGVILIGLAFAFSIAYVNPVFQEWFYNQFPIMQQFQISSNSNDGFN